LDKTEQASGKQQLAGSLGETETKTYIQGQRHLSGHQW
jgi:hypothetical protein